MVSLPDPPKDAAQRTPVVPEHQRILAAYHGTYDDPRLEALVRQMVDKLVAASERPDQNYRITILNSPAINAFALPSGQLYVTRGLITMVPVIGAETSALDVPYKGMVWRAGNLVLSYEQGVVIAITAVLCTGLYLLFKRTKVGIAMQASSQNQLAAHYMGIPVKRLNGLVWGLSAGVAAFAGLLLAPFTFVHVNMGYIGLKAFPAAVVGGFGSLPGAVVGGLVIGVVEALAGFYLPEGFKDVAAYVVVLLMLMVKPNGLFGAATRKKV